MKKLFSAFMIALLFAPSALAVTLNIDHSKAFDQNKIVELPEIEVSVQENTQINSDNGFTLYLSKTKDVLWQNPQNFIEFSGSVVDSGHFDPQIVPEVSIDLKSIYFPVAANWEANETLFINGLQVRTYDEETGVNLEIDINGDGDPDKDINKAFSIEADTSKDNLHPYPIANLQSTLDFSEPSISFSWVNPVDYDFEDVLIRRAEIIEGKQGFFGIVFTGGSEKFTDKNVEEGKQFVYEFIARDKNTNSSEVVEIEIDFTPPIEPEPAPEEPIEPEPAPEEPVEKEVQCAGYTDVLATHPDCEAMIWLKEEGIITGNDDGSLEPGRLVQRDEMLKIAIEMQGKYDPMVDYCEGVNPFLDITEQDWSFNYACFGKKEGVTTGYLDGPNAGKYLSAGTVNRYEKLALLLRSIDESMPDVNTTSFLDVPVGQWFSGFAAFTQQEALHTGDDLNGGSNVERLEVIQTLWQLQQNGYL